MTSLLASPSLLLLLLPVALVTGQATDLTRVAGESGEAVVKATLAQIHESCVFRNDFLFLRRLAYVTSNNGLDPDTYSAGYHGGIWKISQELYDATLNMTTVDFTALEAELNVNWTQTQWSDLRKPLYSGIAAMLTLEGLSSIPPDVQSQAQVFQDITSRNASEYVNMVANLDFDCETDNLDMAFVLDASGSISSLEFRQSTDFTAEVLGGFNVGPDAVRVALMSFSNTPRIHFNFSTHNTTASAQAAVRGMPKYSGGTATDKALDLLRTDVFTTQAGSRPEAARIAIVQTDGRSDSRDNTVEAAQKLKESGVIVFAIGVGNGVDVDELNGIASEPPCAHVRLLNDFTELDSIVTDIKEVACKTEVVQNTNTTNTYTCAGQNIIKVEMDTEASIVMRPELGNVSIFGSFLTSEPNEAFADFTGGAADGKPVVIYLSESDRPLYLSIQAQQSEGQCNSTFLVKIVDSNALKKTGATNLCVKDSVLQDCTDIDYVESGDFTKVNETTIDDNIRELCQGGGAGYHAHPDMPTKYVYCVEGGGAYIVDCPDGFAYLASQQDCAAPVSTTSDQLCLVCSADNWQLGFRRFPLLSSTQSYVQCTGVEQCDLKLCPEGFLYKPDDQSCVEDENNSAVATGASHALCVFSVWFIMGFLQA